MLSARIIGADILGNPRRPGDAAVAFRGRHKGNLAARSDYRDRRVCAQSRYIKHPFVEWRFVQ